MKHFFFDTNILIDFLADRKPFSVLTAGLFDHAEKGRVKIYVSSVSYNNIYYILKQLLSHRETLNLLSELDGLTEIIDVTKTVIKDSLKSTFKDFEDAIQYHSALSNKKIEAIVTRDAKGFKDSTIAILTPDEAISILNGTN